MRFPSYARALRAEAVFEAFSLTAFGSFLLRYDDDVDPLIDLPIGYGYYYLPISMLPVAGAQIDGTRGKWDGRLQFANSSPVNPRGPFSSGEYGTGPAAPDTPSVSLDTSWGLLFVDALGRPQE